MIPIFTLPYMYIHVCILYVLKLCSMNQQLTDIWYSEYLYKLHTYIVWCNKYQKWDMLSGWKYTFKVNYIECEVEIITSL